MNLPPYWKTVELLPWIRQGTSATGNGRVLKGEDPKTVITRER